MMFQLWWRFLLSDAAEHLSWLYRQKQPFAELSLSETIQKDIAKTIRLKNCNFKFGDWRGDHIMESAVRGDTKELMKLPVQAGDLW